MIDWICNDDSLEAYLARHPDERGKVQAGPPREMPSGADVRGLVGIYMIVEKK